LDPIDSDSPPFCPNCGRREFVSDQESGEVICISCGMVIVEKGVTRAQEWNDFNNTRDKTVSRATPIFDGFKGMGRRTNTDIGYSQYDASGKVLSPETVATFVRLKRTSIAVADRKDVRNTAVARNFLIGYRDKLNLPNRVCDQAADMYMQILKADLLRGRTIDTMITACLYAAIRDNELPITMDTLSLVSVTGQDKKKIAANYRLIIRSLNVKPMRRSPIIFIRKFISQHNLNGEFELKAVEVIKRMATSKRFIGSNPQCMSACAIYIAGKILKFPYIQSDIAKTCGITEVSLRSHIKRCKMELGIVWE